MIDQFNLAEATERAAEVAQANASEVDRTGSFPRDTIEALRETGLLALISATEVGGRGAGMRAAATVIERLARSCASTAMVTMMHYTATAVIEAHGPEE